MKRTAGFSLIELLIVVAIILIIAAIAIPSLMRARIAANESAMVGDIRTVLSAEATFQAGVSGIGTLACLRAPATCVVGAGTVPLIDSALASGADKSGYRRVFLTNGVAVPGARVIGGVFAGFCYGGEPIAGIRSFSGDDSWLLVQNATGVPCCVAGVNNVACQTLAQ